MGGAAGGDRLSLTPCVLADGRWPFAMLACSSRTSSSNASIKPARGKLGVCEACSLGGTGVRGFKDEMGALAKERVPRS